MLQYVNSVLVGKVQGTTAKTLATAVAGDILMFDNTGAIISTEANAAAANEIKLGLVTDKVQNYTNPSTGASTSIKVIKYTNLIPKNSIRTYNKFAYKAASEDVIVINFGSFTPVIGNRYVLRIIYKDLYEHPGQFTHTYEVIANTAVLKDLVESFAKLINRDSRRRVVATENDSSITLTALAKDDNEGKESINIYTQVDMEAVIYYTDPSATGFASKNKYPLAGVTITKTPGTPGLGNPKVIRDREQAALSYKGITNRTWWPVIKPELNVNLSGKYDGAVIEFEPEHRTAEDGFRKTKQSVEVYVENTTTFAASLIGKQIEAFINGIPATEE